MPRKKKEKKKKQRKKERKKERKTFRVYFHEISQSIFTRFDVLTAMKIQIAVFWVVTPCSEMAGYQRLLSPWFSKTVVSCHITIWRHNPEDRDLKRYSDCQIKGSETDGA
jgi:hypothetical protein